MNEKPRIMHSPMSGKTYFVTKFYRDGRAKEKFDITEAIQSEITRSNLQLLDELGSYLDNSIKTTIISGYQSISDGQYIKPLDVALWAEAKRKEIKEGK